MIYVMEKVEIKDIGDALPLIGEFGRFQCLLDGVMFLMNMGPYYFTLIMFFESLAPSWMCLRNSTICVWNTTFPGDDHRRCDIPRAEWQYTENRSFSLVTSFQLDCNDAWVLQLLQSIFFLAWAIGSVVLGWVADNYGRKTVFFPSYITLLVTGCLSIFSPHVIMVAICQFIIGFSFAGTTMQSFIIMSELVGNEQRPFVSLIIFFAVPISLIILTLKAYLLKDWKILVAVSTLPYIPLVGFYKFFPESIKWLHHHGKINELTHTLKRIASWNKKEFPSNVIISPGNIDHGSKSRPTDIFKTRTVAMQSCTQGVMWCSVAMGYYGILLAANNLGGSVYRDFALLNLGQVVAIIISMYVPRIFGRKKSALIPLAMASLVCISLAVIPLHLKALRVSFGMLGKVLVGTAFNTLFLWTSELYPTGIRAEGLGFVEVCARVGSAASPWIAKMFVRFGKWVPFVIMGILLMIGSLCGIILPETKKNASVSDEQIEQRNGNKRTSIGHANVNYDGDMSR